MKRIESLLEHIFRKDFHDEPSTAGLPVYRLTAFYVWIISFILFFATLFFYVGTRSLFGQVSTFPWTETFEDASTTRASWTNQYVVNTANWTYLAGSSGGSVVSAQSGGLNARFTGSSSGNITKLVTPALDLSAVANAKLSFWYAQENWAGDQNQLKVYYKTSAGGTWVEIASYTSNISSWTQIQDLVLPNTCSTYYIAFEGIDNYGYANVLDNINVSGDLSACDAVPDPQNTLASSVLVCSGSTSVLSLQNNPLGSGVTYQWQSSPNNSVWSDISGQTNANTTQIITADTYFRCQVTCPSFGTGVSNSVLVETIGILPSCYCTPTYSSGGSSDNITSVVFGTLSDTPPANTSPYYFDRTGSQNAIPTLLLGESEDISISFGSDGNQYSRIWIDFNQNGVFEDVESFSSGTNAGSGGSVTFAVDVPVGAIPGQTLMRVRGGDDNSIASSQSCNASSSSYGQALDYFVTVSAAVDMTFVSSTSTQSNTSVISTGSLNQEIICVAVVTSGTLNALNLTELRMRTDGTTAPLTDISNAKIWYSGNSSVFSLSSQFGSVVAAPPVAGTDMVFSGNQTLLPGTNYFWMTYDITSGALDGNFADAKFQSAVIGGSTIIPDIAEPVGNRELLRGCFYTLELRDDAGNGWDDNSLTVNVDGITQLSNVSFASGNFATFQFVAETGQIISTEYTSGVSPTAKSYFITNPNGAYILSSGEAQTVPVNETAAANCQAIKEFTVNGDAYQSGSACFIITEKLAGQSSSIWSNYKIDIASDFSIGFDLYAGDGLGEGADGIAFVLQGDCTSAGGNGSSMGYGGITNSLGIEFDTYCNFDDNSDPNADHIAIISNGDPDHALSTNLAGPYQTTGLEDDTWHDVIITWVAATQTITVSYDGLTILTYSGDIVTDLFGGNSQVFWGLTGGTGLYYNLQQVCITDYPQNSTQIDNMTICSGCSVNVEVASGASSYSWEPNDGSVSDPTAHNPTLTPAVTTEYTCNIIDGCGNCIANKFTVYVGTLPVSLTYFDAKCEGNKVIVSWQTASEINNDFFLIERSQDAINWEIAGNVNGSGNSNIILNYSFVDDRVFTGTGYYRLRQVDFDGKNEVFYPVAVACDEESDTFINVYPNPFVDEINIVYSGQFKTTLELDIYDSTGRLVFNDIVQTEDYRSEYKFNLQFLKPSIYYITIKSDGKAYNYRIVKSN